MSEQFPARFGCSKSVVETNCLTEQGGGGILREKYFLNVHIQTVLGNTLTKWDFDSGKRFS